ncbi:hypothetical protein SYK_03970 [Pseudodesulfovibrio nedwellii]|uniref:Uncharacterized protein n=1 Tax=Pseudodesulfovibrio nedwellii TaxID=2973072 RepID=A0ABN6S202_9BACT|nr:MULTISPECIES: hypothetical protein [Pseudodesulfovibrio]BDQ36037.1 hypothetical protein SYK_03970 [Pseudodesulfovibrio nedwellii]
MLLSFPNLHPELWTNGPLKGLKFLDPGLNEASFDQAFRPEDLPLDHNTATALINDCINFGEQFKDPSEMAYFGAVTTDDFYEGSSMSIQAQLTRQFDDGQGSKQEREEKEARSKAQFILLLAWFFEERMIELSGLEKGIKARWKSMDTTLGVDDEDRINERVVDLGNAQSHTGGVSDGQTIPLPWQRVVEALPAFIPEDTTLVCSNSEIIDAWEELDIEFSENEDGMLTATLPAWKFAGRRRAPEGTPTALKSVTVGILK